MVYWFIGLLGDWVVGDLGWRPREIWRLLERGNLDEVLRCQEIIHQRMRRSSIGFELRLRQLYHDREEITGYLAQTR